VVGGLKDDEGNQCKVKGLQQGSAKREEKKVDHWGKVSDERPLLEALPI
jgi:hypothetical protein